VRPSPDQDSGAISGAAVRPTSRASAMPVPWKTRSGQTFSPDGAIGTAERARPRTASSMATRAPRELPRTCALPTRVLSTASVIAATVGR
jgi:hypothetical protein